MLLQPLPFLVCVCLFFLGLVPYAHPWIVQGCPFPWAAKDGMTLGTQLCPEWEHVPQYTWGDRRSLQGAVNHFLRRDYGTFVLAAGGAEAHGKPVSLVEGMRLYLNDLVGPRLDERHAGSRRSHDGQLLYYGAPLALLGAASILSGSSFLGRAAAAARILLLAFVFYSVVFHSLANLPISVPLFLAVHARFWQMPNSSVFIFVGIGFEVFCSLSKSWTSLFPPTEPQTDHASCAVEYSSEQNAYSSLFAEGWSLETAHDGFWHLFVSTFSWFTTSRRKIKAKIVR